MVDIHNFKKLLIIGQRKKNDGDKLMGTIQSAISKAPQLVSTIFEKVRFTKQNVTEKVKTHVENFIKNT